MVSNPTEDIKEMQPKFLDQELAINMDLFQKNKLHCEIIYPDGSSKIHVKNLENPYQVKIGKRRSYFILPSCIIRGKKNRMMWYYNNPFPIGHTYENSTLTALDLHTKDEKAKMDIKKVALLSKVKIDPEVVYAGFNNKVMVNFYKGAGLSTKNFLIIFLIIAVAIGVVLQLTGTVDVMAILGVGGK